MSWNALQSLKKHRGVVDLICFQFFVAILNYWCLQHGSRQQQMRDWSSSWTILWLCTEVCLHVSDYLPLHMYACVGSLLHIFLSLNPFFLTQPLLHLHSSLCVSPSFVVQSFVSSCLWSWAEEDSNLLEAKCLYLGRLRTGSHVTPSALGPHGRYLEVSSWLSHYCARVCRQ